MIEISSIGQLSDRDLLAHVHSAAARERDATAQLVALLMELDARRLYLAEGCASLFAYCRQVLHLSEHAAYHRIEAARAARRFPVILERAAGGEATIANLQLLCRAHNAYEAEQYDGSRWPPLLPDERERPGAGLATRSGPSSSGQPVVIALRQHGVVAPSPLPP